ncbi:MAG: hypothetical protein GY929_10720 [Actinomycetia bacterium]|nr:hypothetical protein [Actinomycetes bacterium]
MSGPTSHIAPYAEALADAIEATVPGWVERCVAERSGSTDLAEAGRAAGETAAAETIPAVRRLLATDIDDQWTNPLALIRAAVVHPTRVLNEAGVPPIPRDEFAERAFPEDVYGLIPASFADVDPRLHEPGLAWGAAKAHAHLTRRRGD